MIHRVKLTNGRVLLIEEDTSSLHIASEMTNHPGEVEGYICTISGSGVLVMPNSGGEPEWVSEGLTRSPNVPLPAELAEWERDGFKES